ncbi:MAG: potassium transporter [Peptococcaceae bacterium BRH_c4b]|nr:MAG: potassium transporter [Peptococcaceae bacterium BRH_c4b]
MTHVDLSNIAIVFLFIALATIVSARLNFSSIPFLIILGMLVGPHAPAAGNLSLQLVSPCESVELLSRLGVLLMLFYLGLEFSAGKLAASGKSLAKSGTLYVGLNFLRGVILGWIIFQSWTEALIMASITGISSSTIITKLLVDLKRTANPETELILGIMVYEDLFIAIYLSVMSGVLLTGTIDPWLLLPGVLAILALILVVFTLGRHLAGLLDPLLKFKNIECFTVAVFTLLLFTAIGVEKINVAEAIGALLLGLILAETTHNKKAIQIITPMRDLFGSVFFFSFGMAINYRLFKEVVLIALAAVVVTVAGNIVSGLLAAWLSGYKQRRAFNVAFTMMARGEFSVILASLAVSAGASPQLPSIAALYVLVLAFISPVLAKNSRNFYDYCMKFKNFLPNRKNTGAGKAVQ